MAGTPSETILVQGRSYELKESPYSLFYENEPPLAGQTVFLATEQLDVSCEFKADHANKLVFPTSPIVITYCGQSSSHNILELDFVGNDEPLFMTTGNDKGVVFVFIINEENQTMRFKGLFKQKPMITMSI
jgi:hypothetical protein